MKKRKIAINGVLLLDKPSYIGSQVVLQKVKRIFNALKAGHIGTLDPLASGLLPICFGEATKFSRFKNNANKVYRAVIKLGMRTDTADALGKVIADGQVNFTSREITLALNSFVGEIQQIPPMYSAVKHKGKALYQYAREGFVIERLPRKVTIHSIIWCDEKKKVTDSIEVEIYCSKGTYIRTLADDLGQFLGCGGHLTSLRRLSIDNWHVDQSIDLNTLIDMSVQNEIILNVDSSLQDKDHLENHIEDPRLSLSFLNLFKGSAWLLTDALLDDLSEIILKVDEVKRFLLGQKLRVSYPGDQLKFEKSNKSMRQIYSRKLLSFDANQNIVLAVYSIEGKFLGIANYFSGLLSPLRLVAI